MAFSFSAVAEAAKTADNTGETDAGFELQSTNDYGEYLAAHDSCDYQGADISFAAVSYTSSTLEKPEVYEDDKKNPVLHLTQAPARFDWAVQAPVAGYYQVSLLYRPLSVSEDAIEIAFYVNNNIPYDICENLSLSRLWKDDGEVNVDKSGNESSPSQKQVEEWNDQFLLDPNGLYLDPLKVYLEAGENLLSIELLSGQLDLSKIRLSGAKSNPTYEDYRAEHKQYEAYTGAPIIIEAQDAYRKSSKELRPLSDNSDPMNTPASAYNTCINHIGGNSWNSTGEWISWTVMVEQDGLYEISFRYRQPYLNNASSIRTLRIDGDTPFKEAEEIRFPYQTKWKIMTLGSEDSPCLVYLPKGPHTFEMNVSLGATAEISRELETVVANVGDLYRQIIMITGTSPDANRDYRLFEQIPSMNERLQAYSNELRNLATQYDTLSDVSGGSNAVILNNLANTLDRMYNSKFRAHVYVNDLFNNYSSAGAWVYDMRSMPMDIEKIILSAPNSDLSVFLSTWPQRFKFEIQKLIASYLVDYNTIGDGKGEEKSISVWVNLGRDQTQVLSNMLRDSFTPKSGVTVQLKIVNATMIQALLSGQAPDSTIMLERSSPVNLAMRGALYDLTNFDDYNEVVSSRYREGMVTPYTYKGGVYGLPDTETFNLMFIRDDVFNELGLKVPETWDEFLNCSAVLMRNNLSVGLPTMYTTFLYQFGGTLYNDTLTATQLTTTEAIDAFNYMMSLYTDYQLPVSFSFYNRFRTGEMPLGISGCADYATLMAAAPEIRGRWSVHPFPGIKQEDGSINRVAVGGGTACVILGTSQKKDEAWSFLKWWTDSEAQYRYSSDIESVLGVAARHPTANLEALKAMSWGRGNVEILDLQWKNTLDLPEIPGGYYLTRALDNAFFSVYNDNKLPKDMLTKWAGMVDEEITRKYAEIESLHLQPLS